MTDVVEYIAANYTRRAELLLTQRRYISPGLRGTAGNVACPIRAASRLHERNYGWLTFTHIYAYIQLISFIHRTKNIRQQHGKQHTHTHAATHKRK